MIKSFGLVIFLVVSNAVEANDYLDPYYSGVINKNQNSIKKLDKEIKSTSDQQERQRLQREKQDLKRQNDRLFNEQMYRVPEASRFIDPSTGLPSPPKSGASASDVGNSPGMETPRLCNTNSDCDYGWFCGFPICRRYSLDR
jgi:hypothetical protein